jgi:glycosyltransferase involved in cell wall biosynthesis
MKDTPVVSVVIIFLDAERFLREAIESVLGQTFDKWELLLVDDGSTDGSEAIARSYADLRPDRISYLEHPEHRNLGMSASRNRGIRESRGEFVAFLDADDVWFPTALADQVGILRENEEAAMVYGPLSWWFSWTSHPEDRDYVEELGVPADSLIAPPRLLPLFLLDRAAVPSGLLVRRTAIERVGGFEDAFPGEYEDQVFCAKICLNLPVYVAGASWYRYRQHADSAVAVGLRSGDTDQARLVFLHWLAGYLREAAIDDPSVQQAVRHELRRAEHPRLHRLLTRLRSAGRRVNAVGSAGTGGTVE